MTYLFVDVETPGLDPSMPIIEIAWLLTDNNLRPLDREPRSFIIDYDRWPEVWAALNDNEYVRAMHTKTGLLAELDDASNNLVPFLDVFDALLEDLRAVPSEESIHLAGFSVGFDRAFMESNGFGPLFNSDRLGIQFHHRLLDLSAMKLMYGIAGLAVPTVENPMPHRALSDCYEALGFARAIRSELRLMDQYRAATSYFDPVPDDLADKSIAVMRDALDGAPIHTYGSTT